MWPCVKLQIIATHGGAFMNNMGEFEKSTEDKMVKKHSLNRIRQSYDTVAMCVCK